MFRLQAAHRVRLAAGNDSIRMPITSGSDSCRDTAWLLVTIFPNLGFATRFVSGYLIQLNPDVRDLHALAEVYLPGAGWVRLDPTSGLFIAEGHIPLAATADPQSAAPVSGSVSERGVEFL